MGGEQFLIDTNSCPDPKLITEPKTSVHSALLPETAVERFDEGVVRGFPWAREVQDHAMGIAHRSVSWEGN
jgi:hypothetical protein